MTMLNITYRQAEELIQELKVALEYAQKRWDSVGDGSPVFIPAKDAGAVVVLSGISLVGSNSCVAIPGERIEYSSDAEIVILKG